MSSRQIQIFGVGCPPGARIQLDFGTHFTKKRLDVQIVANAKNAAANQSRPNYVAEGAWDLRKKKTRPWTARSSNFILTCLVMTTLQAVRRRTPRFDHSFHDIANSVPSIDSAPTTHEELVVACVIMANRRDNGGGEGFRFERPTCRGAPNPTAASHRGVRCDR